MVRVGIVDVVKPEQLLLGFLRLLWLLGLASALVFLSHVLLLFVRRLRQELEPLEQPGARRLLAGERAGRAVPGAVREAGEGLVQGIELGGRDLDGAAIEVAVVAEDGEAVEDGPVLGVELSVGAPVRLVEAYGDAAGREAGGLGGDGFDVHIESLVKTGPGYNGFGRNAT
jgi:hypothetical protein